MSHVNLFDAKSNLSNLVQRALSGEEIIIAKRGAPLVKLVPVERLQRKPGSAAGKLSMTADFDALLSEFADYR